MPSWTLLKPGSPSCFSSESSDPAHWHATILAAAPVSTTSISTAYPDSLDPFAKSLALKFPQASITPMVHSPAPSQLLDYYTPSSSTPLHHYIVSPLHESLTGSHPQEFYYRPAHTLLPYALYEADPTCDVPLDTAAILAIFYAGSWAIPADVLEGWWRGYVEDPKSRILNKMYVVHCPFLIV